MVRCRLAATAWLTTLTPACRNCTTPLKAPLGTIAFSLSMTPTLRAFATRPHDHTHTHTSSKHKAHTPAHSNQHEAKQNSRRPASRASQYRSPAEHVGSQRRAPNQPTGDRPTAIRKRRRTKQARMRASRRARMRASRRARTHARTHARTPASKRTSATHNVRSGKREQLGPLTTPRKCVGDCSNSHTGTHNHECSRAVLWHTHTYHVHEG